MARPRKVVYSSVPQETKFQKEDSVDLPDGFTVSVGEIFKVKGEYGGRFKFRSYTTNIETGTSWVDCFEMHKGQAGVMRSFTVDRIKRIPVRGKRVRRRKAN